MSKSIRNTKDYIEVLATIEEIRGKIIKEVSTGIEKNKIDIIVMLENGISAMPK